MFKAIIEFISDVVKTKEEFYNLEKNIPKSEILTKEDEDLIEQEFWNRNLRASFFDRYY